MYKNMSKEDLLKLHNSTLTEKEYFLDLIENKNITEHEHICNCVGYKAKAITVDNIEISIKVVS